MSYDLKKACQNIQDHQRRFAFYKGANANELFITELAVNSHQIEEAEKTCGELKLEGKGFCYWGVNGEEQGRLVFVAKAPKIRWEMDFTNVFKKRHHVTDVPKITVRDMHDNESEDPADAPAPAGAAKAATPATQKPAPPPASAKPARDISTATPEPAGNGAPASDRAVEQLHEIAERLKPQIMEGLPRHAKDKEKVTSLLSSYRKSLDEHQLRAAGESLRDLNTLVRGWDEERESAEGEGAEKTVEEVLAEKRPRPLPKDSIEADFGPDRIRDLREQTKRGFLKGLGDFGDVLGRAEAFYEALEKVDKGERSKKSLRKKGASDNGYLAGKLQSFIEEAEGYVSKFGKENVALKRGFFRTRKRDADATRDTKIEACESLLAAAKDLQVQYKNAATFDLLDDLQKKNAESGLTAEEEEKYHGSLAAVYADSFGQKKVGVGTSDVALIGSPNGGVAYAFKSIDGESWQTGMAKGSASIREALSSAVSNEVLAQTGIDFGFPKTTIVSFDGKKGALIEGINGQVIEANWSDKARDAATAERAEAEGISEGEAWNRIKKEGTQASDDAPPTELQKVLLFNFLTGQTDIKWDNVMWEEGEGGMVARPFDGGAGFPDVEMMKRFRAQVGRGDSTFGSALLANAMESFQDLPVATMPVDKRFVDGILKINVKALERTVRNESRRLARANPEFDGKFDDVSVKIWRAGILAIQEALRRDPKLSTKDLVDAYSRAINETTDSYS